MRFLVTGANGFVGSHLVRHLLSEGHEVRAMARGSSDRSLLDGTSPDWVVADATAPETLPPALEGVDAVVHLAAALQVADQAAFDRVNVAGTGALVDAVLAHRPGLERFVLVSSIAAAGPAPSDRPGTEADAPRPVSMYGRSKLGGEREVARLAGHVPYTIARPPIVYGPGGLSMVTLFRSVARGLIVTPGGPARPASFVEVRDLAAALGAVATHPEARDETFFVVGPEDGTLADFQREIARQLDVKARQLAIPPAALALAGRGADAFKAFTGRRFPFGRDKCAEALAASWRMSGDKAAERVGWRGATGWRAGIAASIADYRARGWL